MQMVWPLCSSFVQGLCLRLDRGSSLTASPAFLLSTADLSFSVDYCIPGPKYEGLEKSFGFISVRDFNIL